MKVLRLLSIAILLLPSLGYAEEEEEDYTVGYKVVLVNKTGVQLNGSIEFELINNSKHAITIPANGEFIGYAGKIGEHLTEGEKAIIGKAGQAIGAAASAYAGSKEVELPEGTADAAGGIATAVLNWFDTCLRNFSVVYKGYEYTYKFGNGCVDQEFSLVPANKGTELRIFDAQGKAESWGSKMRVSRS